MTAPLIRKGENCRIQACLPCQLVISSAESLHRIFSCWFERWRRGIAGPMDRLRPGNFHVNHYHTAIVTVMSGYHDVDKMGMQISLAEAPKGYEAGGIPIGSAVNLFSNGNVDGQEVKLLGSGHNQRVQKSSPTLHGEISALEAAGRLKPEMYRNSIIVSSFHDTICSS